MESRFKIYDDQIKELLSGKNPKGSIEIAKLILGTTKGRRECNNVDSLAKYIKRHTGRLAGVNKAPDEDTDNVSKTDPNEYNAKGGLSAMKDGKLMKIEEYCEHWGLDYENASSYKLITHTGVPYWNIVFREQEAEPAVDFQELQFIIAQALIGVKHTPRRKENFGRVGVVKIADLHLGAYVDNLIRTKDFSIDILAKKLYRAADEVNRRGYSLVHIHVLGDLIESFSGLSHKNTWKGLDKAMVGAEAVKLVVRILHDNFLDRIHNLGEVKVVAGNHDRTSSDNKEDVQGDAANLICWGLELMGYSVEFNPLVITHVVDGICHILTHGHHGISQKSTKQLCWDYGKQGMYNLICEGHLHSIIEKLSVAQREKFQTVKDDSVDHRRMNCPSFFTGNFYSEALGYSSESGFVITEDNGNGVPHVFYYAI